MVHSSSRILYCCLKGRTFYLLIWKDLQDTLLSEKMQGVDSVNNRLLLYKRWKGQGAIFKFIYINSVRGQKHKELRLMVFLGEG